MANGSIRDQLAAALGDKFALVKDEIATAAGLAEFMTNLSAAVHARFGLVGDRVVLPTDADKLVELREALDKAGKDSVPYETAATLDIPPEAIPLLAERCADAIHVTLRIAHELGPVPRALPADWKTKGLTVFAEVRLPSAKPLWPLIADFARLPTSRILEIPHLVVEGEQDQLLEVVREARSVTHLRVDYVPGIEKAIAMTVTDLTLDGFTGTYEGQLPITIKRLTLNMHRDAPINVGRLINPTDSLVVVINADRIHVRHLAQVASIAKRLIVRGVCGAPSDFASLVLPEGSHLSTCDGTPVPDAYRRHASADPPGGWRGERDFPEPPPGQRGGGFASIGGGRSD